MTHTLVPLSRIVVVSAPESPSLAVPSGLIVTPAGEYDDFALLAASMCEAAAAIVLLSDGEGMREVGRYRKIGEPHLHSLASIGISDQTGSSVGLLCILDPYRRTLTTSQTEQLQPLVRQIAAFRQVRRESVTDALTGLANRRAFEARLVQEVERSQRYGTPLSLLMIDVDDFKDYNDAFGHPAGDGVLKQLAELLFSSARASDLVTRYGGEEFAVIVPETEAHGALFLAERCRRTTELVHWPHRGVTVSVGVASMPPCGKDGMDLLEAADRALYRAKGRGGNRTARAPDSWSKTRN